MAKPLDDYAGQTYNLEVEARDGGTAFKSSRAQAVVRVLDTHNSRPEIIMSVLGSSATTTLSELADLGRVVAHILVRDSDSGLNGIVTCYLNATHFQLQAMDVGQYKVILSRPLDREAQDTHVVNVTCEDAGKPPLSDSKIFRVKVSSCLLPFSPSFFSSLSLFFNFFFAFSIYWDFFVSLIEDIYIFCVMGTDFFCPRWKVILFSLQET